MIVIQMDKYVVSKHSISNLPSEIERRMWCKGIISRQRCLFWLPEVNHVKYNQDNTYSFVTVILHSSHNRLEMLPWKVEDWTYAVDSHVIRSQLTMIVNKSNTNMSQALCPGKKR